MIGGDGGDAGGGDHSVSVRQKDQIWKPDEEKVVKPAIARGFGKFMPARWMRHFVPWHVRPRGWSWDWLFIKDWKHRRILRLVQPFSRFNCILKELVWPNSQTFQLQPEGFLHSMLLPSCRSLLRNLLHGLPWQFILRWGWTKIRSNMGQLPIEPALLKLDFSCSPCLWWISPIASWCHMVFLNLWNRFHVLLCVMGFWSVFIVTGEHCLSIAQVWPHLLRGFWCWLAGRVRCLKKTQNDKILDRFFDQRHALPTILHARKDWYASAQSIVSTCTGYNMFIYSRSQAKQIHLRIFG